MKDQNCDFCNHVSGVCTECEGCFGEHCQCDPCAHGRMRSEPCVFCVREPISKTVLTVEDIMLGRVVPNVEG